MSVKENLKTIYDDLPDNCTIQDVVFYLRLAEKLKRSEDDIKAGRVYTHEEAVKKLHEWRRKWKLKDAARRAKKKRASSAKDSKKKTYRSK